jgi:hypothetical protein
MDIRVSKAREVSPSIQNMVDVDGPPRFPHDGSSREERRRIGITAEQDVLYIAQVMLNGIFVNWELAERPVDDNPTFRDLAHPKLEVTGSGLP